MNAAPFFSVVIPTRNRKQLVGDAIWSVLRQTFADLEIVVLDNSDDGQECQSVIPTVDDRIRYVRSGGLSMPDNWERAFNVAGGQFICILSDRLVWSSKHLLQSVFDTLEESQCEVVSWKFAQAQRLEQNLAKRSGLFCTYRSRDVVSRMFEMDCRFFSDVGPRGLNSAISRAVIDRLQDKVGRACLPYSPDYTLATSVLMATDQILHLDASGVFEQGCDVSNGLNSRQNFDYCCDAIRTHGGTLAGSYAHVPAKFPTGNNSILNDVLATVRRWDQDVPLSSWNAKNYIQMVYEDLQRFAVSSDCSDLYRQLCEVATNMNVDPPPPLPATLTATEAESKDLGGQPAPLSWRRVVRGIGNRLRKPLTDANDALPPSTEQVTPSIRDLVEQYESSVICQAKIHATSGIHQ